MEEGEDEMKEELNEEDLINDPKGPTAHGNIAEEEEMEEGEIDLENMSEDDLKSFIESVISDMIEAGELEAGEDMEDEDEEIDLEIEDDEEMEEDETEELMAEVKKMKKEVEEAKKAKSRAEKELKEALSTISTIKSELNEVNLFNAKLLYTNKIFKAKNLTESQKVKVLTSFDKATSVKEAQLVFETLSEGFKEKKSPINESLLRGSASKPTGVAEKKPILEVNDQFARWQKLAGIKN
jgi:seryl-tRNA synthetase